MPFNLQNNSPTSTKRVLLAIFLVIPLIMVTLYAREGEGGPLHSVQNAVGGVIAPVQFVGSQAGAATETVGNAVTDATADAETLSQLRERNAELTNLVAQTEEYKQEVERLQELLNFKQAYNLEGIGAHIIGRSTDAWNQTITIDVGSSDGVATGLTVMDASGVVGQIIETTPGTSRVRLLTDPQSGAAALIQSNRAEGVVRGSLDGLLYLENIDADVEVEVGDLVLTSGLGGSYTRGLLIGQVVKIEGNVGDAARRIVVSPNSVVHATEEVIVVADATDSTSSANEDSSEG